jgi:hypothetical protein
VLKGRIGEYLQTEGVPAEVEAGQLGGAGTGWSRGGTYGTEKRATCSARLLFAAMRVSLPMWEPLSLIGWSGIMPLSALLIEFAQDCVGSGIALATGLFWASVSAYFAYASVKLPRS